MVKTSIILSIFSVFLFLNSSAKAEEFYQPTYEASRALFLENVRNLQKNLPEIKHQTFLIPSQTSEKLATDLLYLPPKSGKKDRLLILISGIHGVEGFVGSALQNMFIKENFWQLRDENLGILFIHSLNPYGFKFERRVSENNVDLNRNFSTNEELFAIKNEGYQQVSPLLNPSGPATSGLWDRFKFYFTCGKTILKYSMESLRRAILKGQYEEPLGIYFGGKKFEPQKEILEKEFLRIAPEYQQVLLIDLHTGYGERGHLHLFADRAPEIDPAYLAKLFAGHSLDFGSKKDFYEATGGLVVYTGKLLKNKTRYAGIVFEFGTLDSQKTLGSLDSLYRMVRENQAIHHGAASPDVHKEIRWSFREMFYPSDPAWQREVATQFRETLSLALKNQKALN